MKFKKTIIHINKNIIQQNKKRGTKQIRVPKKPKRVDGDKKEED